MFFAGGDQLRERRVQAPQRCARCRVDARVLAPSSLACARVSASSRAVSQAIAASTTAAPAAKAGHSQCGGASWTGRQHVALAAHGEHHSLAHRRSRRVSHEAAPHLHVDAARGCLRPALPGRRPQQGSLLARHRTAAVGGEVAQARYALLASFGARSPSAKRTSRRSRSATPPANATSRTSSGRAGERRSTASMRASSSRTLKGLVT